VFRRFLASSFSMAFWGGIFGGKLSSPGNTKRGKKHGRLGIAPPPRSRHISLWGQAFEAFAPSLIQHHPNHIPPWRGSYRRPSPRVYFSCHFLRCWGSCVKKKIAKAKREESGGISLASFVQASCFWFFCVMFFWGKGVSIMQRDNIGSATGHIVFCSCVDIFLSDSVVEVWQRGRVLAVDARGER